ncbi:MAG: hypothetical protein IPI46_00020 [Bacteroidetes bacterium]|nr:hypothetical protein [Bacteroidota bacterium]
MPIINDYLNEYAEYYIEMSNAQNSTNASPMYISNQYAYCYIDDDDPFVGMVITSVPAYIGETGGTQTFTVNLSAAQSYSVSVNYQTINYSASCWSDYTHTNGTLIFTPGQTTQEYCCSHFE